jgi:hypothetical protein
MAVISLSPAVTIQEVDLTNVVPAVASTPAGTVGVFSWGPTMVPTLLGSENELVSLFGKPDANTFPYFYNVVNFLQYGGAAYITRTRTGSLNATTSGTGLLIDNEEMYDTSYATGAGSVGEFAARYAGVLGNSITVSMADTGSWEIAGTGTISTLTTSKVVTGVSTTFTSQAKVGDIIKTAAGARIGVIKTITSNTSLTLAENALVAVTTSTYLVGWAYQDLFSGKPTTSDFAANVGGSNDELHLVVLDTLGKFTGVINQVLEIYPYVSKGSDVKSTQGASNYYAQVLRVSSPYIYWMDNPSAGTNWGTTATNKTFASLSSYYINALTGGIDDNAPTDAELIAAYDLYKDSEQIDVSLIPVGKASTTVAQYVIQSIADYRKDCVAFVSPVDTSTGDPVIGSTPDKIEKLIAYREALNLSSSYGVCDTGYKYQYDRYNDVFRWVPLSGDIAGLCARTDNIADPWFSPAGLNRGTIKNVAKLAVNPNKTQRDALANKSINSVVNTKSSGPVLFGDKTLLSKPSAFDHINVRRLFIVLEKSIATASKYFLFEQNDDFTRSQFRATIEPFLRDVQGRRGLISFRVICDASNNTDQVISNNELRGNILIKPTYSINTISLTFTAVRGSVSFEEIAS